MNFVTINNTSIKLSNIKSFGVGTTNNRFIDLQIFGPNEQTGFWAAVNSTINLINRFRGASGDIIYPTGEYKRTRYEFYSDRRSINQDVYYYRTDKNSEPVKEHTE